MIIDYEPASDADTGLREDCLDALEDALKGREREVVLKDILRVTYDLQGLLEARVKQLDRVLCHTRIELREFCTAEKEE